MHDAMDPPLRRSFTFISSEVSETPVSNRNKKRMFGGADDKTNSSTSKTWCKRPETVNDAQKSVEHSRSSTQDDQATSTLDSLRVLNGGELTKLYPSTSSLLGKEESMKKRSFEHGMICFCASHASKSSSTGEKRIDEMMDYAIQNLSEAGKALTNLGDNFEHDLKLMFMDIMGRVQHWVNVVQNRIHAARADLESIRKESVARVSDQSAKDLELITLRKKLDEAEVNLAEQRKLCLETAPDPSASSGQASPTERVSISVQTINDNDRVDEGDELQRRSSVPLVNTGCQCENDREAELEAELAQLLEENERMIKEHAEYESAIHCALLRGVSSLNIEALKVLRHPPIPCCTPCRVSSPSSSSPAPVITCRPRTTRRDVALPQAVQRGLMNAASKNEKSDKSKGKNVLARTNCCQPLSEHLLYCSGGDERSQENSMLFLLHHGDAGSQCQPCIQARYRPNGNPTTRGSVCVSGRIKKPAAAGIKEKISCATRPPAGSRPASYDLSVRNRDDSGENCTARKNTLISKRCGACCNGNRRNRDE